MPELNGKINVKVWPDQGFKNVLDSVTAVEVTSVTIVPGATSGAVEPIGSGTSVIPTATPFVSSAAKVSVVETTDKGVRSKETKGGFNAKVNGSLSEVSEPDRPCDNVTEFAFTWATVVGVPLVMKDDPETTIPTVTPLVSGKDKTMRGSEGVGDSPSMVAGAPLVVRSKENTFAVVGSTRELGARARNVTTVPAGT
jgi:hypothetical protein